MVIGCPGVTVVAVILNVLCGSQGVVEAELVPDALDTFLETLITTDDCTETVALTVGVVTTGDNALNYHKVLGLRDVEENLKTDDKTVFGIGSTTKAMTAIIADKVLKSKGNTWDTPIVQFYPNFTLPGVERTEKVTFRDLFGHRTCVARSDFWWASGPKKFDINYMMSHLQYLEADCGFRSEFKYNNLMYVAGSTIIEHLTGKSWVEMLKEYVFEPLQMTESYATFMEAAEAGNIVRGYMYSAGEGEFSPLAPDADKIIDMVKQAGSVHSTARDMNKYLEHIIANEGAAFADLFWDHTKVFPIGQYFGVTPEVTKPTYPVNSVLQEYTIGWVLGEYRGEEILVHGGNTFSTHTLITLSRERGYGIFVSCTGGKLALHSIQLITWYIQDLLIGAEPWITQENICTFPQEWTGERAVFPSGDPDWEDYVVDYSEDLRKFAKTYKHEVFGETHITFGTFLGLHFQYESVNCTLKRKKDSETLFRCHARSPALPLDTSVGVADRILQVRFLDGDLYSNFLEKGLYRFSSAQRNTAGLLVVVLVSVILGLIS